ncbi:hypothetical protein SD961_14635 [Erwinia sp. MMLR14_017]|uniref:hypothetical protein n=1 Tax=Erwinia sp. MMLR14_017 TaxID=3093842 RepID=UPI00298FE980|nr:hypothetical protein [Erwinia sp. MMLR14_017]MDW8847108.1 hypothetical protein [Erwinia sp. MMLR14_017]
MMKFSTKFYLRDFEGKLNGGITGRVKKLWFDADQNPSLQRSYYDQITPFASGMLCLNHQQNNRTIEPNENQQLDRPF